MKNIDGLTNELTREYTLRKQQPASLLMTDKSYECLPRPACSRPGTIETSKVSLAPTQGGGRELAVGVPKQRVEWPSTQYQSVLMFKTKLPMAKAMDGTKSYHVNSDILYERTSGSCTGRGLNDGVGWAKLSRSASWRDRCNMERIYASVVHDLSRGFSERTQDGLSPPQSSADDEGGHPGVPDYQKPHGGLIRL